jgi:hypothetical protein
MGIQGRKTGRRRDNEEEQWARPSYVRLPSGPEEAEKTDNSGLDRALRGRGWR